MCQSSGRFPTRDIARSIKSVDQNRSSNDTLSWQIAFPAIKQLCNQSTRLRRRYRLVTIECPVSPLPPSCLHRRKRPPQAQTRRPRSFSLLHVRLCRRESVVFVGVGCARRDFFFFFRVSAFCPSTRMSSGRRRWRTSTLSRRCRTCSARGASTRRSSTSPSRRRCASRGAEQAVLLYCY